MAAYKYVECCVCLQQEKNMHPSLPVCAYCLDWLGCKVATLETVVEKLVEKSKVSPHNKNHLVYRFMRYLEYEPVPHNVWKTARNTLENVGFQYNYNLIEEPPTFDETASRPDYGEYA